MSSASLPLPPSVFGTYHQPSIHPGLSLPLSLPPAPFPAPSHFRHLLSPRFSAAQSQAWVTKYVAHMQENGVEGSMPHVDRAVLSAVEAGAVVDTLFSLRHQWTYRFDGLVPLFTLGAASYLDGDGPAYHQRAGRDNAVLAQHFGWLHARIAARLKTITGRSVRMMPRASLPGFHMFLAHRLFERPIYRTHSDAQYLERRPRGQVNGESGAGHKGDGGDSGEFDQGGLLSFTLAVALPDEAGLRLYLPGPCASGDYANAALAEDVEGHCRVYERYKVGDLVVHGELMVHSIAPSVYDGREGRVTLQGHAMLGTDGMWELYW